MKVLIGCEESGNVREEFEKLGHDVMSCDLLPSRKPGKHYQGDIFDVLYDGWDLAILFPPCTYLCNSGVRWLHSDITRWPKMFDGALFFKRLAQAPIERIAIENPIMHKYAKAIIGMDQAQVIQPWQFGHGETKGTCLFLKNLPQLVPTNIVEGREQRIHRLPPGKDRAMIRSETFPGIAKAMAEQWGNINKSQENL